jgi:FkbM family methyltransferase
MRRVMTLLKSLLPPKLSYQLRVRKALIVDEDLKILEKLAKEVGSKQLVALDIGANAGIYAAVLSKYFGQVVCFEPNPECVAYLKQVLPKNCLLIEGAVSSESGIAHLTIPVLNKVLETTRGTISARNNFDVASDIREISVKKHRLDDILGENKLRITGRIGLLKIDVEGHEYEVMQGAPDLLATHRPVIIAELEERHGTPVRDVLNYLVSNGYKPTQKQNRVPKAQHTDVNPNFDDVNYIFYPI